MLSNAYFLAKFRFDTAENEPAKNLQIFAKLANFADSATLSRRSHAAGLAVHGEAGCAHIPFHKIDVNGKVPPAFDTMSSMRVFLIIES